jgi:hypothetical protein
VEDSVVLAAVAMAHGVIDVMERLEQMVVALAVAAETLKAKADLAALELSLSRM